MDTRRPSLFWRTTSVFVILSQVLLMDSAMGQVSNPVIIVVSVAPSGACTAPTPLRLVQPAGTLYSCQNGTWGQVGSGSGGTISSITSTGSSLSVTNGTGPTTNLEINPAHTNTYTAKQIYDSTNGIQVGFGILHYSFSPAGIVSNVGMTSPGYTSTVYISSPSTIASSATPVIGTDSLQIITLSANATPTIPTIFTGARLTLTICQPSVGGPFTWAPPAVMHGAISSATIAAMAANTCAVQSFDSYNGTTMMAESTGVTGIAP